MVIPKSVTPKWIIENQKATDIILDKDEIQQLVGIDKNFRIFRVLIMFMPKGTTIEQAYDVEEDEKFVIKRN